MEVLEFYLSCLKFEQTERVEKRIELALEIWKNFFTNTKAKQIDVDFLIRNQVCLLVVLKKIFNKKRKKKTK